MQKNGTIVRYTTEEIDEMIARGEDRTDWARVDAMTEEELESSIDKEEEGEFEGSVGFPGIPGIKREITLPISDEVIQWFRLQGSDYMDQMNTVLLEYVRKQLTQKTIGK